MMELTPLSALAIPLIGALLISTDPKRANVREAITLITALLLAFAVGSLVPSAFAPTQVQQVVEVMPSIWLAFHVEPLGMTYAIIASGLWIVNSIYSIGYMRANQEKHQTRFFVCFAVSIACTLGVAFSANLFTLFVCYEALSLATFPLVTHKGSPDAIRSGRTYLGILMGTSVGLLLPAMIATYVLCGTLDFSEGGIFSGPLEQGSVIPFVFGGIYFLCIYGIGKAALMPAHRWLPAAMVAPTPVSALLHAVAVVKAGVFTVVKVSVYIFGLDALHSTQQSQWLVYMAGASILIASLIALFQDNLKRRLAYSTVSQLSYITLGTAMAVPLAVQGATLHIAAHAFGKITLFFAAGSIYTAAHKTKVSELDGIGRKMPWTMAAFAIGSMSMIGLPPTGGFISKWYLLSGAWNSEQIFAIVVIVLSTLLNAGYFLPIVHRAFFRPPPRRQSDSHESSNVDDHASASSSAPGHHQTHEEHHDHGEAPLPIVIALTTTAACTVLMFFFPNIFYYLSTTLLERLA